MVMVCMEESVQVPLLVYNFIVFVPAVEYTTLGFCTVDVAGVAPLPKFHVYVTPVVVPVLVKLTAKPVH